jgi:hypothetical protein
MPFFSMVARSASCTPPFFMHSSMNSASLGLSLRRLEREGCSGATAANVIPMIVSARVVKTLRPFLSSRMRRAVSAS